MIYKREKVAENNIEVTPQKTIKDINDNDVIIWDEDRKQSHGQDAITEGKANSKTSLENANSFNVVFYKAKLIADAYEDVKYWDDNQVTMDKVI